LGIYIPGSVVLISGITRALEFPGYVQIELADVTEHGTAIENAKFLQSLAGF
jgi:hypothetical protein